MIFLQRVGFVALSQTDECLLLLLTLSPFIVSQKTADGTAEVERSAVQLVSRLPDETLCKLLGMREVWLAVS